MKKILLATLLAFSASTVMANTVHFDSGNTTTTHQQVKAQKKVVKKKVKKAKTAKKQVKKAVKKAKTR